MYSADSWQYVQIVRFTWWTGPNKALSLKYFIQSITPFFFFFCLLLHLLIQHHILYLLKYLPSSWELSVSKHQDALTMGLRTTVSVGSWQIVTCLRTDVPRSQTPHHCVDRYEGCVDNIKVTVLCQWRNQIKLSTSYFFIFYSKTASWPMRYGKEEHLCRQQRCPCQRLTAKTPDAIINTLMLLLTSQ